MKHHNDRLAAWSRRLDPLWRLTALALRAAPAGTAPTVPRSILVVELHLLGDMVMLIPLLRVIRRCHPAAHIGLMAGGYARDVLADTGLVDEFIMLRAPWVSKGQGLRGLQGVRHAVRESRRRSWDWGIDVRGDVRNVLLLTLARARRRIAYNFTGGAALLTDVVPDDGVLRHIVDHHAALAQYLGMPMTAEERIPSLRRDGGLNPPTGVSRSAAQTTEFLERRPRRVGFHFGASLVLRRLPIEEACALIALFQDAANTRLIVVDAPELLDFNSAVLQRLPPACTERIERWRGSLKEFITFLPSLDQFFAMDSGPAHLAGALGIDTTVFFGPHLSMAVRPMGRRVTVVEREGINCRPCDQHRCVNRRHQECLTDVVRLLREESAVPDSAAVLPGAARLRRDLSGVS